MDGHTALPVDRRGDAEPGGAHVGPRRPGLLQLGGEVLDEPVLAQPNRGLRALVVDLLLGIDDPDEHLCAAQVNADRFASAQRREGSGGGMRKY